MIKYITKRLLLGVVTFVIVVTLTFFLMNIIPGGPFVSEKAVSVETTAMLNAKYGLDKPLFTQYVTYLTDLVKGDLGLSVKQRGYTVNRVIAEKLPTSMKVGGLSVLLSLFIGLPLGCIAAVNRNKTLDKVISFFSTLGVAIPSFVLCSLLQYFFSVKLNIFPVSGLHSPIYYVLPVISLSFYPSAYIARMTRSSMLDVLSQDYIRTGKSKGLSNATLIFKHALRNALLPVITYLGPMIAYTLTGSFVVEVIFSIDGIGRTFITSAQNRDYPVIMGATIVLTALMIVLNIVVDVVYKIIDPRIKLD